MQSSNMKQSRSMRKRQRRCKETNQDMYCCPGKCRFAVGGKVLCKRCLAGTESCPHPVGEPSVPRCCSPCRCADTLIQSLLLLVESMKLEYNEKADMMKKADSTLRSSRTVPHPSTNRALRRLTSEVERDPVHSTRYGRQQEIMSL